MLPERVMVGGWDLIVAIGYFLLQDERFLVGCHQLEDSAVGRSTICQELENRTALKVQPCELPGSDIFVFSRKES